MKIYNYNSRYIIPMWLYSIFIILLGYGGSYFIFKDLDDIFKLEPTLFLFLFIFLLNTHLTVTFLIYNVKISLCHKYYIVDIDTETITVPYCLSMNPLYWFESPLIVLPFSKIKNLKCEVFGGEEIGFFIHLKYKKYFIHKKCFLNDIDYSSFKEKIELIV